VGTGIPITFIDLAKSIVAIAGSGRAAFTECTPEKKEVEPEDYYTDISKIKGVVGWEPRTPADEGIRQTIALYRERKDHH